MLLLVLELDYSERGSAVGELTAALTTLLSAFHPYVVVAGSGDSLTRRTLWCTMLHGSPTNTPTSDAECWGRCRAVSCAQ